MRYVIFGTGRVASSLAPWLGALGHEATLIPKGEADPGSKICRAALANADVIAAAIPDDAIAGWRDLFSGLIGGRPAIHFSGAAVVEGVWSCHPLCSFPKTPLPSSALDRVAFALEAGAPDLKQLIPGAPNPTLRIAAADRAFYHALAVLSGNFAAHLFNETAKAMAARLGVDAGAVLTPYLEGVVARFAENPASSMTGPVARRDRTTVAANLAALEATPDLANLYRAFLASAWPDR